MMRLASFVGVVPLLLVLASPRPAAACACCSDPGQRTEVVSKLDTYVHDELDKLRFAKKTKLFTGPAGLQNVSGIDDPTDDYDLALARAANRWTFTFKDGNGKTGTLAFTLPTTIDSFFVDMQDGKPRVDPVLYKEWRITAPVTATGVFAPTAKAMIRLVLQGRGNSCTDAEQLTAYTLEVRGKDVSYTFFGKLVK